MRLTRSGLCISKSDTEAELAGGMQIWAKLLPAAKGTSHYGTQLGLQWIVPAAGDGSTSSDKRTWMKRLRTHRVETTCFKNDTFLVKSTSTSANKRQTTRANYSLGLIFSCTLAMRWFIRANRQSILVLVLPQFHEVGQFHETKTLRSRILAPMSSNDTGGLYFGS